MVLPSLSVKLSVHVPVPSVFTFGISDTTLFVIVLPVAKVHCPTSVPVMFPVQHVHSLTPSKLITFPTVLFPVVGAMIVE